MFNWYWSIKRWIKNFSIYDITIGIANLVKWFKIIWNDRDFDQGYLYDIMYFKLDNMQKFFESENTYSIDAKDYAKQIKYCKELLYRIMNESIYDENWDGENFTKSLHEIDILDKQEKELFWNSMCEYIDGWWD